MRIINGNNYFFDGQNLFSYQTKVAELRDGVLVELGKFSQTTSKHCRKVADELGVYLQKATNKVNY